MFSRRVYRPYSFFFKFSSNKIYHERYLLHFQVHGDLYIFAKFKYLLHLRDVLAYGGPI